jgi:hypothetical protein
MGHILGHDGVAAADGASTTDTSTMSSWPDLPASTPTFFARSKAAPAYRWSPVAMILAYPIFGDASNTRMGPKAAKELPARAALLVLFQFPAGRIDLEVINGFIDLPEYSVRVSWSCEIVMASTSASKLRVRLNASSILDRSSD